MNTKPNVYWNFKTLAGLGRRSQDDYESQAQNNSCTDNFFCVFSLARVLVTDRFSDTKAKDLKFGIIDL
jgi:hypothetical protein